MCRREGKKGGGEWDKCNRIINKNIFKWLKKEKEKREEHSMRQIETRQEN